jgi:hypothetical protein
MTENKEEKQVRQTLDDCHAARTRLMAHVDKLIHENRPVAPKDKEAFIRDMYFAFQS